MSIIRIRWSWTHRLESARSESGGTPDRQEARRMNLSPPDEQHLHRAIELSSGDTPTAISHSDRF
jgi:hypothetical protein